MESSVHQAEHENEQTHWWFVGRRELFTRILTRNITLSDAEIVDLGTSTGTNLRMFAELGAQHVRGVEIDPRAAEYAREKTGYPVIVADCTALPFNASEMDCVIATDVVEHILDDKSALMEMRRVIKPNGLLLLTVPAFMSLWGTQDDLSHHKRRYRKPELIALLEEANFAVVRAWYFNFFLFPAIFVARQLLSRIGTQMRSEGDLNSPLLNAALLKLFRLDCRLSELLQFPFGVSICVVAKAK